MPPCDRRVLQVWGLATWTAKFFAVPVVPVPVHTGTFPRHACVLLCTSGTELDGDDGVYDDTVSCGCLGMIAPVDVVVSVQVSAVSLAC